MYLHTYTNDDAFSLSLLVATVSLARMHDWSNMGKLREASSHKTVTGKPSNPQPNVSMFKHHTDNPTLIGISKLQLFVDDPADTAEKRQDTLG